MTNALSKLFREYRPESTFLSETSPQTAPHTTRYAPVENDTLEEFHYMDIPPLIVLSSLTGPIITITEDDYSD